ncbi:MAG: hypothetical protein D6722_21450 [Bacteroidetes bacterium]|nr:MAG: hypothetical protein D6722_21450 [Bacteroidota bacterium]
MDVTVQKSIGKGTFFLLTGSLYNSTYTTLIPDKVFDTKYNGNFGLSAMGGKEWPIGENSSLMTSARVVLNGGLRYQAIDEELSYGDVVVYDEDQAWTQTRGNYFRTDLRIAYRWNRKLAYLFSLDVQNATNHQNVLEDSWNAWMNNGAGGIYTRYQAGLIPVFSFQVDF